MIQFKVASTPPKANIGTQHWFVDDFIFLSHNFFFGCPCVFFWGADVFSWCLMSYLLDSCRSRGANSDFTPVLQALIDTNSVKKKHRNVCWTRRCLRHRSRLEHSMQKFHSLSLNTSCSRKTVIRCGYFHCLPHFKQPSPGKQWEIKVNFRIPGRMQGSLNGTHFVSAANVWQLRRMSHKR